MKTVERINFCRTCLSFWHPPFLGWIMGSFIGALLIGKVRGSWIPTHLHPLSAYVNSFPALILSSPCLFPSFTFLCRIEKCFKSFTGSEHKKSHTAFPMEMQLVHYKVNLIYMFARLKSESPKSNWRNISRRGFQIWRPPWRRANTTLLQFFPFSTQYSFVRWQVSLSEDFGSYKTNTDFDIGHGYFDND